MHTFKEIIDNQEEFRDNILMSLSEDINETKSILKDIKSTDDYILKEKKKLEKKIRTVKRNHIEKLFFMNPNRDKEYYAWWDDTLKETLILRYD